MVCSVSRIAYCVYRISGKRLVVGDFAGQVDLQAKNEQKSVRKVTKIERNEPLLVKKIQEIYKN